MRLLSLASIFSLLTAFLSKSAPSTTCLSLALAVHSIPLAASTASTASPKSCKQTKPPVLSSGLHNLGNTCYLNAQLQCSFHIPHIRDLVLESASKQLDDESDTEESIGLLALRAVFASMLDASSSPVPTTPRILCEGLGINVFEQQDSQEFWKLLLPVLEHSPLLDVYQGAFEDYIVAQDGSGREKRREEPFLDISLEVDSGSVFESLQSTFTEPELLSTREGNGWRPEKGADRVDAFKGSLLRVQGLPSILQLHLKRFQYDWNTGIMSKINDCCLFPEELDLSTICSDISKQDESKAIYDLQSIVVHAGAYGSGHYYSYVRPDITTSKWYRFDDHRVTEVDYYDDVIRDAFGGRMEQKETTTSMPTDAEDSPKIGFFRRLFGKNNGSSSRDIYGYGGRASSAYMLQYVKRSDITNLYN